MEAGTIRTTKQVYLRHECRCGKPAVFCHDYLLPNPRSNRQSSAFGKDDISWCRDHSEYTCKSCKAPDVEGFKWSGKRDGEQMPHLVHFFMEISREDRAPFNEAAA